MKKRPSVQKRSREQLKAERQREKAERRDLRKAEVAARPVVDGEDPDLAGIVPGPQPLDPTLFGTDD